MSIAGISSSTYSSYTAFSMPAMDGMASVASSVSGGAGMSSAANLNGVSGESLYASFQQAITSGDPMRMLVAMLLMNLLLGETGEDRQQKTKDALASLGALAMMGQLGGSAFSQSTSLIVTQQSASGAYTANAVAPVSSFSASA